MSSLRPSLFFATAACWLTVIGAGCTRNPTKSEARTYYRKHKLTLERVDRLVQAGVDAPAGQQKSWHEQLHPLLRGGVIGVRITYVVGTQPRRHVLGEVGLTPGRIFRGYVPPAKGLQVDGRHVGRGRFQTAYQDHRGMKYGDGKPRPGIHVAWFFRRGERRYRVEVVALVDHDPGEAWQAGWRKQPE